MAKVAIIGAGSVEFTRNILADLCSYEELHGTLEIALHDIDADRLATAEWAATSLVDQTNAGYGVKALHDRRAAFDGADYLINEIQVGGYAATVTDFDIPRRYGLRQTIADTIGIGGIMRGLRTIPVMVGMGDDMAEVCPHGLLLNYTNPMAMVPWGIWAGSAFPAERTIGVCHSGRHQVGVPLHLVTPAASKATSSSLTELLRVKITRPPETTGDELNVFDVSPPLTKSGWHTVGVPEQFVAPAASKAIRAPRLPAA